MWSKNAAMRFLRPGDWVVPRCGLCATFWCGVVFILSSIVLLVTSKHKGRLYQSWGLIMLGCGCCLMLICVILCIHAFFVMSAVTRNRQVGVVERKFELVPVPDTRHVVSNTDELHHLLADSSPSTRFTGNSTQSSTPAGERRTRLTRMEAVDVDDSGSQTSSTCPTSSSSTSTTPPGRFSPPSVCRAGEPSRQCTTTSLPAQAHSDPAAAGTAIRQPLPVLVRSSVAVCRVRPLPNIDWRPPSNHATAEPPQRDKPTEPSASVQRQTSVKVGSPVVRRELGRGAAITVTPLSDRRRRWLQSDPGAPDDDCMASADDSLTSGYDFAESKATVYDNVQQLYV